MSEQENPEQTPFDKKILYAALNISDEGGVDRLTDLIWETNKRLIPSEALFAGSYRSKDQFKSNYEEEFRILGDKNREMVDVNITLADGQHRLIISVDRGDPKYSGVTLSQSGLEPDPEVKKRWENLIHTPK
jgi:hypothetical protein